MIDKFKNTVEFLCFSGWLAGSLAELTFLPLAVVVFAMFANARFRPYSASWALASDRTHVDDENGRQSFRLHFAAHNTP